MISWGPGSSWGGLARGWHAGVRCLWFVDEVTKESLGKLNPLCVQLAAGTEPWPALGLVFPGRRQG